MKFAALLLLALPLAVIATTCTDNVILASSFSGSGSSCAGSARHYWPLNNVNDCHGWRGTDSTGKVHDNSAKNIRCNSDNTGILYDQYAGNINCSGSPVAKEYKSTCVQGQPPTLYDQIKDANCCSNPSAASCTTTMTGLPRLTDSTSTDISIFLNNVNCGANASSGSTGSPASSLQAIGKLELVTLLFVTVLVFTALI